MAFSILVLGLQSCHSSIQSFPSPFQYFSTQKTQRLDRRKRSKKNVTYGMSRKITTNRRSANYKPNIWDYDFLMQLTGNSMDDCHKMNIDQLKENVKDLLHEKSVGKEEKLDLIDSIERLGIMYHFSEEIKRILDDVCDDLDKGSCLDLYTTSLYFRLLRQHGYRVTEAVFTRFTDDKGSWKVSLCKDVKGMLALYEASFLGLKDENLLDEAKSFTTYYLKDLKGDIDATLAKEVAHSLELPLHWRTEISEARWFIDTYGSEDNMIPAILHLAKLNFNISQATYQNEVGILTRWWVDMGLFKMEFSRDRIVEHFFWSLGAISEPQYGQSRINLAKLGALITLIDDIYDVYGSYEELVLFTDAVERWDITAMEELPAYMKISYMALLKTNTDIAYDILKEKGFDITSNQKKVWVDICKSYLVEAKWYHNGYTPRMDEYLEKAIVTIGSPLLLMNCYIFVTGNITKETLAYLDCLPSLVYNAAMHCRLIDDLATSSDEIVRGDNPKSIQCYMREAGVPEKVAREHVRDLINETWKRMNGALLDEIHFPGAFLRAALNFNRQSHSMYEFGDGHGKPDKTKDHLISLLIEPIPINTI